MSSLTPASRNQEVTDEVMSEGYINAFLTFVPTLGGLYVAMKNPTFRARTNWQSRTALVAMPTLFVFAWTAESHLQRRMHEIAKETEHQEKTVQWAEEAMQTARTQSVLDSEKQLTKLYYDSVLKSGVKVVPGDQLEWYHKGANFVAENPIKVLASLAVPAVATIFYGQAGEQHLEFSVKLLHTRVFGQFATISLLLSVMGFKDYMDRNGKFITEAEADARVQEMREVRESLMTRLAAEREHQKLLQDEVKKAHDEAVAHKKKHH